MRTKQLFLILALLCTMVQGAWAQASWDEVYAMTNTTEANWTALPEGTTAGGGSTPAAATKKKQTEIKHFNINNKNEKDSALDLWSLV